MVSPTHAQIVHGVETVAGDRARRLLVLLLALGAVAGLAGSPGIAAAACVAADSSSRVACTYATGASTLVLPAGASALTVDVFGAQGGADVSPGGTGGKGAEVRASFGVPATGDTLSITVGGAGGSALLGGTGGFPDGAVGGVDGTTHASGGGGSTSIISGGAVLVFAGGGGGAGSGQLAGLSAGGNAGADGSSGSFAGSGGLSAVGSEPGSGGLIAGVMNCPGGNGRKGVVGATGQSHVGGAGGSAEFPGGGGGGGAAGGGGGASGSGCIDLQMDPLEGGGGGGGSSAFSATPGTGTAEQGSSAPGLGDGKAVVTFVVAPPVARLSAAPAVGPSSLATTLYACSSSATGAIAEYDWDTNGDGVRDATSTACTLTFSHAAPGAFTSTVSIIDTYGQVSTASIAYTIDSKPSVTSQGATTTSIAAPAVHALWRNGQLDGSLAIKGTASGAANLTIRVFHHGAKKVLEKASFAVHAGRWSRTLALPSRLLPGRFDVKLTGTGPQAGVASSATTFTLAIPSTGIVTQSLASQRRNGPAATTFDATSELWARFRFGILPRAGAHITTQWTGPGGQVLAPRIRPRITIVEAELAELSGKSLPSGIWRCVLRVGGVQVAVLRLTVG
jgi:hypothetical protein